MKRAGEKKRRKTGLLVALILFIALGAGIAIGLSAVFREHREIMALPLDAVDFSGLQDGVYIGEYEGGMYGWRENKVQVTVKDGKVSDIKLIGAAFDAAGTSDPAPLYGRVIEEQSLQVDAISGATVTSKGYLQAVENALLQAEK